MTRRLIPSLLLLLSACSGTTGSGLVTFSVTGAGAIDVAAPLSFVTPNGFQISLTRASLHINSIYFNQSRPSSGGPQEPCILPGIYVGQAFGSCDPATAVCGVDIDLLNLSSKPFPVLGQGTLNHVAEADIWLSGGPIDAPIDATPILDLAGIATRAGDTWPFTGTMTISANRAQPPPNVGMPGANPICRKRIASQIPVDFTLQNGGALSLSVDPRALFNEVDFTLLAAAGSGTTLLLPDDTSTFGESLYDGVIANSGVYQFVWTNPGPH